MNKRGSASLMLLLLMPILLTAGVLAFSGAMSIRITDQTHLICREGLLEAETHVIANLEKLMSLNPAAKILRQAKNASQLTMAIPIYGPLSAMSIQEARMILHGLQLQVLTTANLQLKKDLLVLKTEIGRVSSFNSNPILSVRIPNSPQLAVDASPPLDLTPDYNPKKNFSDLMLTQLAWNIDLKQLFPRWLTQFLISNHINVESFNLKLACAATAQKNLSEGTTKWNATLIEKTRAQMSAITARQLLNSL